VIPLQLLFTSAGPLARESYCDVLRLNLRDRFEKTEYRSAPEFDCALRQIQEFGPRSAERMRLWIVRAQKRSAGSDRTRLNDTRQAIHPCELCGSLYHERNLEICAIPRASVGCSALSTAYRHLPLEKTGAFCGRYHSLEEEFRRSIMLVPGSADQELLERLDREDLRLFLRFPLMSK